MAGQHQRRQAGGLGLVAGRRAALVVINLSWLPLTGSATSTTPPRQGANGNSEVCSTAPYQRDGDDLAANGLYVSRPAWGVHVLAAAPAGISIPDVAHSAPRAS